jgi:hypothetical protein
MAVGYGISDCLGAKSFGGPASHPELGAIVRRVFAHAPTCGTLAMWVAVSCSHSNRSPFFLFSAAVARPGILRPARASGRFNGRLQMHRRDLRVVPQRRAELSTHWHRVRAVSICACGSLRAHELRACLGQNGYETKSKLAQILSLRSDSFHTDCAAARSFESFLPAQ